MSASTRARKITSAQTHLMHAANQLYDAIADLEARRTAGEITEAEAERQQDIIDVWQPLRRLREQVDAL